MAKRKLKEVSPVLVGNKLRVAHHPNIPCQAFTVEVGNEREALNMVNAFANQHIWLFENGFIPDYSNIIYVEMFNEKEGVWEDYYNPLEEMEWDEFESTYLTKG